MKKKEMPIEKSAFQLLTGDELEELVAFKESPVFDILKKLVEYEKYSIFRENFYAVDSMEEVYVLRGRNVSLDFIMSATYEAKKELTRRGAEIDTED